MPAKRKEPRKTPTQERSKATVQFIIEATRRLIARDGTAKVNVNDIAAAAGVSVASLYQYFPTKDAVLAACEEQSLVHVASTFSERALSLHAERVPLDRAIQELVVMSLELMEAHVRLFGTIETSDHPARVEVRKQLIDSAAALVAFMLEGRVDDEPRLRGKDLGRASRITLETMVALGYHNFQVAHDGLTLDAYHREIARMMTSYLLGPEPLSTPLKAPSG